MFVCEEHQELCVRGVCMNVVCACMWCVCVCGVCVRYEGCMCVRGVCCVKKINEGNDTKDQ